jgi:ComF family protein
MIPQAYRPYLLPECEVPSNRLRSAFKQTARSVLGLLYPAHCLACDRPLPFDGNGALCLNCAERIEWIGSDHCLCCGDRAGEGRGTIKACPQCLRHAPPFLKQCCAVARYAEPLRALILALKFGRQLSSLDLLSALLAHRMQDVLPAIATDRQACLVPVPLHQSTARERGFNQTALLAEQVGRRLKLQVCPDLVIKTRSTAPQAKLDRNQRAENLAASFCVNTKRSPRYIDCSIILIDDVRTTGSTLIECARTLHHAGLKKVFAAVLAHG